MLNKSKIFYIIFLFLLPISNFFIFVYNSSLQLNIIYKIAILFVSIMLSGLSYYYNKLKNVRAYRFCFLINILIVVFGIGYSILNKYELLSIFNSVSSFKSFILSTGKLGMIVYILIQFLQVMFIPIPSMIITLTGVAIYGPILGSFLCIIGVLSASLTSFMLGKIFGYKLVSWLVGEKQANKYANILNEKGKFFLIIAFLLPLFPDDVLCLIAGMTTMKFKTFCIIASITRPIGIIFMSFFGGGYIIPFTGWGLYVWPFLLVFIIASVVLVYKYQSQLENFILTKILRFKKYNKSNLNFQTNKPVK